MMEPLGEEEERVLKEFEFDSGKLVGELGQDFEGLGALLDTIRRMGAEIQVSHLEYICKHKTDSMNDLQRKEKDALEKMYEQLKAQEHCWQEEKQYLEQQYSNLLAEFRTRAQECEEVAEKTRQKLFGLEQMCEKLTHESNSMGNTLSNANKARSSLLAACALLSGALCPLYDRVCAMTSQRDLLQDQVDLHAQLNQRIRSLLYALPTNVENNQDEARLRQRRAKHLVYVFRRAVIAVLAANRLRALARKSCSLFVWADGSRGSTGIQVCVGESKGRHHGSSFEEEGVDCVEALDWLTSCNLYSAIVTSVSELQDILSKPDPNSWLSGHSLISATRNSFAKLMDNLSVLMESARGNPCGCRAYLGGDSLVQRLAFGLRRINAQALEVGFYDKLPSTCFGTVIFASKNLNTNPKYAFVLEFVMFASGTEKIRDKELIINHMKAVDATLNVHVLRNFMALYSLAAAKVETLTTGRESLRVHFEPEAAAVPPAPAPAPDESLHAHFEPEAASTTPAPDESFWGHTGHQLAKTPPAHAHDSEDIVQSRVSPQAPRTPPAPVPAPDDIFQPRVSHPEHPGHHRLLFLLLMIPFSLVFHPEHPGLHRLLFLLLMIPFSLVFHPEHPGLHRLLFLLPPDAHGSEPSHPRFIYGPESHPDRSHSRDFQMLQPETDLSSDVIDPRTYTLSVTSIPSDVTPGRTYTDPFGFTWYPKDAVHLGVLLLLILFGFLFYLKQLVHLLHLLLLMMISFSLVFHPEHPGHHRLLFLLLMIKFSLLFHLKHPGHHRLLLLLLMISFSLVFHPKHSGHHWLLFLLLVIKFSLLFRLKHPGHHRLLFLLLMIQFSLVFQPEYPGHHWLLFLLLMISFSLVFHPKHSGHHWLLFLLLVVSFSLVFRLKHPGHHRLLFLLLMHTGVSLAIRVLFTGQKVILTGVTDEISRCCNLKLYSPPV
ncbi:hypothetical protein DUI87_31251 [Hirundo rustica rustica]|uniref:Uncharacterized protein n=1 Tax=Hirundo rustica rustica TaxID=333673 RepID=A0A3M0JCF0_HIRRU|nr:hypothetical protein DUI87_31251 [Hirundo rustica rustica]